MWHWAEACPTIAGHTTGHLVAQAGYPLGPPLGPPAKFGTVVRYPIGFASKVRRYISANCSSVICSARNPASGQGSIASFP